MSNKITFKFKFREYCTLIIDFHNSQKKKNVSIKTQKNLALKVVRILVSFIKFLNLEIYYGNAKKG